MSKSNWIRTLTPGDNRPPLALEAYPELAFNNLLQTYHYRFQKLEEAAQLAAYLSSLYPEACQQRVELGINELFLNAIEHGNLNIDFELKSKLKAAHAWESEINKRLNEDHHLNKSVEVRLDIHPDYYSLCITDQGSGFNWRDYNESKLSTKTFHGRGLMVAKEICFDKVEFSEKGNQVTCTVYTRYP